MMTLQMRPERGAALRVLCLGAHSDDIEIGCGGSLLRLVRERGKALDVTWVVFSANGAREQEAAASARAFLKGAGRSRIVTLHHRDGYFPYTADAVKDSFERLKAECRPDVVFTHYRNDRHQDHRLISDLTWNTFRNHLVLEYEVPKYDGDMGVPNLFMPVDERTARRKARLILTHFRTQRVKHWMTEETLTALLRLRGIEAGRSTRYAEAFYCRKAVL